MKRKAAIILCILMLCVFASSGFTEREIPDILHITQDTVTEHLSQSRIRTYTVVYSAREDINREINARILILADEAEAQTPAGKENDVSRAAVSAVVTRTGSRWMSFHLYARATKGNQQVWARSDDLTFDMETGRLIPLGDIIREDGWDLLIPEIRAQLTGLFPNEEPEPDALDALCCRENIEDAGFIATPGHLALYFPAGDIYPQHAEALLRIEIYVPGLWDLLTDEACREMDCTGYALVALTYDDGPSKGVTRRFLDAAATHPGQITFFLIGTNLRNNPDLVHREYDTGYSLQSHSWVHSVTGVTSAMLTEWEAKYDRTMSEMIGTVPKMMRPPGGQSALYINAGSELPQIRWSINSGDASRDEIDQIYTKALSAGDGDIVLFHDIRTFSAELVDLCMKRFEEKSILLVTVDDLCALRGVELVPGANIESCRGGTAEEE